MDIDVSALKALVREKDLSLDLVVESIEQALLVAYHRTEGSVPRARVTLDRKTGHVTVWAAETDEDGVTVREYDDTPDGFGRIAATTAKQVLLARLREAEGDVTLSEFTGREGDLVSGRGAAVDQPAHGPRRPRQGRGQPASRGAGAGRGVPARHAAEVRRHQRPQGLQGPAGHGVPHPSRPRQAAVRAGGAGDRRRHRPDHRDRPRGRAPHQDRGEVDGAGGQCQGRLHRAAGPAGAAGHGGAERREDRHRRQQRGPGGDDRARPVAGPRHRRA